MNFKNDAFTFKISKSIAQSFRNRLREISIFPVDFIMLNNKWQYSKVYIIMNNWLGYTVTLNDLISIKELPNGGLVFRTQDPQYDNYKLTPIIKCKQYQDGLYYYLWDLNQVNPNKIINSQNLKFTIEELEIELPFKN